MEVKLSKSA